MATDLLTPSVSFARPPYPIWKLVIAGAAFGAVASLITFHPDCTAGGLSRAALAAASVIAGAVTSFFCVISRNVPEERLRIFGGRNEAILIRGLAGALGMLLAAPVVGLMLTLFRSAPWNKGDLIAFVSLLGFWNSFALLYMESQKARTDVLTARSRLRGLEAQIRPHFFFNTLNTVSAFIPERPDQAQAILGRLAGLFRLTLSTSEQTTIPLRQELDVVRGYLEIEQARFGQRLRCRLPELGDAGDLRIPALTLQPMIENAVRHGISRLPEGGEVSVELRREASGYELTVTNPVEDPREIKTDSLLSEGHSLQIVAGRLRLTYRGKARLSVSVDPLFRISMWIPQDVPCER